MKRPCLINSKIQFGFQVYVCMAQILIYVDCIPFFFRYYIIDHYRSLFAKSHPLYVVFFLGGGRAFLDTTLLATSARLQGTRLPGRLPCQTQRHLLKAELCRDNSQMAGMLTELNGSKWRYQETWIWNPWQQICKYFSVSSQQMQISNAHILSHIHVYSNSIK